MIIDPPESVGDLKASVTLSAVELVKTGASGTEGFVAAKI